MNKYYRLLLSLILVISFTEEVKATHVPGGNITYKCLGANSYIITLTVFEDCSGAVTVPNTPQILTVTNSCGFNNFNSITLPVLSYGDEISQVCYPQLPNTTCNGGLLPGIKKHIYSDTINSMTLPGNCNDWKISWDGCCRNTAVNLANQDGYYFEAVINNSNSQCNSSPVIGSNPVPYNCINIPVTYNFQVSEPDGDSLYYSFIAASEIAFGAVGPSPVPYVGGYSPISPINGISLDPNTGEINFTPTIQGAFVVVVKIEEFDSSGTSLGYIMQDFQFQIITQNCINSPPSLPVAPLINFSGNAIYLGGNSIQACEGDSICFDVEFLDVDPLDSIYINSNITQIFPGASFIQNSFFSPATASVCFEVLPGSNPLSSISINVNDNGCPVMGTTSSLINVTVISNTYAGQDITICQGESTQIFASGGSNFNWSIISGDPISFGNNFSCNGCSSPIATPAFSTVYKVVSNLSGGCSNVDTVNINVAPNFNYNLTQSDTVTCLNSLVNFDVTALGIGNFSFQWDPISYLNNPQIGNPEFSSSMSGLMNYNVTITNAQGCLKNDSLSINVLPAYSPNIILTASDTSIICGDSVFMNVNLLGNNPAICSPSGSTSCTSLSSNQIIGSTTGSNTNISYPAPFGNYFKNVKQQYLYRANELQSAGFNGGKITEISWETTSSNNASSNIDDFTIKIGCTSSNSLSSWNLGLSNVFYQQNLSVVLGWNDIVLDNAYEWDGISNLVIEICYTNTNQNTLNFNWSTNNTQTPYNSSIYFKDDVSPSCSYTGPITGSSNKRPITKFRTCPMIPDPSFFSFVWSPSFFLSSSTDQNPNAVPMVSSNYKVLVTDNSGGCKDSADIYIDVICDTCDKPSVFINDLTCYGGSDASIFGSPTGIFGPPWMVYLLDGNYNVLDYDSNVVSTFFFDSLSSGQYVLRSLDTLGCYADTLVTIDDVTPIALIMTNDTIVCLGGNATIGVSATGGSSPYIYNWEGLSSSVTHVVNPLFSQYYKVNVEDSSGCESNYDSVLVALFPPIIINTLTDSICPFDSLDLSVIAFGGNGGPYNYSWTNQSGVQLSNQTTANVSPINPNTYYYVSVSDNCETPENNDSVLVTWYDLPYVDFSSDTSSGCWPVEVLFNNHTNISQVASCDWNFGNGVFSNNLDTVVVIYNSPGSYHVSLQVTNSDGCDNDTTYFNYIEIFDYPVAGFISRPNPASILNPSVQFVDTSSSDVVYFDWTFYDSTNTMIGSDYVQNPTFNFSGIIEQQYYIQLYVENQNGCSDTVNGIQIVEGEYSFFLPNSFTPNGDGLNDSFFPVGDKVSIENYSFKIFNRWGELIFSTNDFNAKWDGTYQNNPLSSDAYIWKIDLLDISTGKEKNLKGYVLLSR